MSTPSRAGSRVFLHLMGPAQIIDCMEPQAAQCGKGGVLGAAELAGTVDAAEADSEAVRGFPAAQIPAVGNAGQHHRAGRG